MINIEGFDPNLRKVDKKRRKNIDIYYIGCITMEDSDYVKINTVNPFYLIINKVDCSIEESSRNKYLVFATADKNKEILEKHTKVWVGIKYHIKTINGGKCSGSVEYGKDYMNMKFS